MWIYIDATLSQYKAIGVLWVTHWSLWGDIGHMNLVRGVRGATRARKRCTMASNSVTRAPLGAETSFPNQSRIRRVI